MIRPILTVASGTLASRLLGFARDALLAALLGAGGVADAFLLAFQLVNVSRRLLTEGALNAALVPAWMRLRDTEGEVAAAAFAGKLLGSIAVAGLAAALLFGVAMPLVVAVLAPGFVGSASLQLAADDARLMLPYLAFAGPVAVTMGLLNAQHRFTLTAFSPLLFNLALIGVVIALLIWRTDDARAATIVSVTVGIAGLLQLLMLAWRRGAAVATPLAVSFDPVMRGFFRKAVPGMIASSGPQLLIVAGAIVASSAPAAVSWLYFANRLIELPLGIVGTAMGTVLLPQLARASRDADAAGAAAASARALELAVGLALPAMIGLIVLRLPIVQLLFQHGAFSIGDAIATAQAVGLLALGLPAQVLVKALAPTFFARHDTTTPLLATLGAVGVAIIASLLLGALFGSAGIAASIALAGWCNAALLLWRGTRSGEVAIDATARRRLALIAVAAAGMGGLLWLLADAVPPHWAQPQNLAGAAALGLMMAGGIATYVALLVLLRVVQPRAAIRALRSRPT